MLRLLRWLAALGAVLSLLLLVAMAGLLGYARTTGAQLVVVTGGSMEPTYALGEGLIIRPLRDGELRPGTIITYRSLEGATLTTHRVLSLHTVDGAPYVRTQGDANATADPNLTPVDAIAGAPVMHVPHGDWIAWLALSPRGRLLLFGLPLLLLVGLEGRRLRTSYRAAVAAQAAASKPTLPRPDDAPPDARHAPFATRPAEQRVEAPAADPPASREVPVAAVRLLATVVVLALTSSVVIGGSVEASRATLADSQSIGGNTFATTSVAAPTTLSAAVSAMAVQLSWTATTSPFATGYDVLRGTSSGGPYAVVASVTGRATTSYADSMASGTVFYVVRATYQNWTSPVSNQVTATAGTVTSTP